MPDTKETKYGTVITAQGAAIIADCILNGKKASIVEAGAGDGGGVPVTPDAEQEELVNERWRGEIAGKCINPTNPNMIDVKVEIGDEVEGFTVREMGLYSDTGVLMAVCSTPETEKAAASQGVVGRLTMIMHILVADPSVLNVMINPSLDMVSALDLQKALQEHDAAPQAHKAIRDSIDALGTRLDGLEDSLEVAEQKADAALQAAQAAQDTADAAQQDASNAQEAADEALRVITQIKNTINIVPTQSGSLTYTGSSQSPAWNSYDTSTLTIGGTTTAANAGTYTATFTPKSGYQWSDGTTTAKSATWTIGRASITAVPAQSVSLTYTGSSRTPSWSNYSSTRLTLGGTTTGINAGTYTAKFTPKSNYKWSDGTTAAKNVTWTIGRASITTTPAQSGSLTYTGSAQTPSWSNYSNTQLTLGGTTSGTNAGSYTATFTPTANYQWSNGSTAAKSVTWKIGKAAGSLSVSPTSVSLTSSSKTKTVSVTRAGTGTVTATSSNTSVATVSVSGTTVTITGVGSGSATVTIKVAASTNYAAPSNKTVSVSSTVPTPVPTSQTITVSVIDPELFVAKSVSLYLDGTKQSSNKLTLSGRSIAGITVTGQDTISKIEIRTGNRALNDQNFAMNSNFNMAVTYANGTSTTITASGGKTEHLTWAVSGLTFIDQADM